jgi:hypothetical protein
MKTRALILAATIASVAASFTAPTAQACVIYPNGDCITSVVTSQPSTSVAKHKVTQPARHHKRHKRALGR